MTVTVVVRRVFFANGFCPSSVQAERLDHVYADELEEKVDFSKKTHCSSQIE